MLTIFVVDDRRECRLLARLLRSQGYHPVCLSNGAEAVAALEESPPDLILLDISMPVIDGLTFRSLLRRNDRWKSLPVVMISAESSDGPLKRAMELGANGVLVKSAFSAKQLLASMRLLATSVPETSPREEAFQKESAAPSD